MRTLIVCLLAVSFVASGCADETVTSPDAEAVPQLAQTDGEESAQARERGFDRAGAADYQVTVENLTTGQPLTPPLLVTHRQAIELFEVGEPASFGVKEIAENGNLGPLLTALDGARHVMDVEVAPAGPVPPVEAGETATAMLHAERGAKYVSFVSMLICTNDGFTGLQSQRLPKKVGDEVVLETIAYDAGTEINTEDFADIVPPCQGLVGVSSEDPGTGVSNPALAEGGVIRPHEGIQGGEDLLVGVHGWEEPVARVTITRTN